MKLLEVSISLTEYHDMPYRLRDGLLIIAEGHAVKIVRDRQRAESSRGRRRG